ncbi:hypothetical protein F5Y06DRAFT_299680 [Hypoxylon sp. FL0890]|nr:hypothetical protein F5Y06DRAFT_299680 [Hypoxylon sp. FL0890]
MARHKAQYLSQVQTSSACAAFTGNEFGRTSRGTSSNSEPNKKIMAFARRQSAMASPSHIDTTIAMTSYQDLEAGSLPAITVTVTITAEEIAQHTPEKHQATSKTYVYGVLSLITERPLTRIVSPPLDLLVAVLERDTTPVLAATVTDVASDSACLPLFLRNR